MAKNISRTGAVAKRKQVKNPVTKLWVKINKMTGKFMDNKTTGGAFKGVRKIK